MFKRLFAWDHIYNTYNTIITTAFKLKSIEDGIVFKFVCIMTA